jgi:hypothetical protein
MDQVTIHAEPCGDRYTCWYPDGWNLLSLPVQPINSDAAVILSVTSAEPQAAYRFTSGYEEADSLSYSEGYWVRFVEPDSISIVGREVKNDVTIRLVNAGWHLISSPFTIDWDRVTVFVNGVERYVGEDAASDVIDNYCACYDTDAKVYRVASEIRPCQGYWIKTLKDNVVLRLEWSQYTAAQPPAQGGCTTGASTTLPPPAVSLNPEGSISSLAYPNPVRHSTVTFELRGSFAGADGIRVQVFTASGKKVWEGEGSGTLITWEPRDEDGGRLPWGPYPYCSYAHIDGRWIRVDCSILFLAEKD